MNILLTGGTGGIGKKLVNKLMSDGHIVRILSRTPEKYKNAFYWDPLKNEIDQDSIVGIQVVIHLAGTPVMKQRWSKGYKSEIRRSRVDSAILLYRTFFEQELAPEKFISSSAAGYYGLNADEEKSESSPAGKDFLVFLEVGRQPAQYLPIHVPDCQPVCHHLSHI